MDAQLLRRVVEAAAALPAARSSMSLEELAYLASLEEHSGAWRAPCEVGGSEPPDGTEPAGGGIAAAGGGADPCERLAERLARRAAGLDGSEVAALRLQVSLDGAHCQCLESAEQVAEEHASAGARLERAALRHELRQRVDVDDLQAAMDDVLDFVAHEGGFARAASRAGGDAPAREELAAALGSVMPLAALPRWLVLARGARAAELLRLAHVAAGVVLHAQAEAGAEREGAEHEGSGAAAGPAARLLPPPPDAALAHAAGLARQLRATGIAAAAAAAARVDADVAECTRLRAEAAAATVEAARAAAGAAAVDSAAVLPPFERAGAAHSALQRKLLAMAPYQRLADFCAALGCRAGASGGRAAAAGTGPPLAPLPPGRARAMLAAAPLRAEAGAQTALHAVERHMDPSYEWSEWALRRKVLQLANLRRCATHSTQTAGSAFRAESASQTWPPRPKASQTGVARAQSQQPRRVRVGVQRLEFDLGQPAPEA